jgi:hypothetical protein
MAFLSSQPSRSHVCVIWITSRYCSRQYRWGVQTKPPITPKFCPICGHNSIERVTRPGVLNLYRCGDGHFFIFDSEPAANDQKAEKK